MPSDLPRVYALTRSGRQWTVHDVARTREPFKGPFLEAWAFASDLATRTAPAVVIALNDLGEPVAREAFG